MTEALKEVPARLKALRDTLLAGLVERDVAIRLALLAALAGEHLLLLGPPGTAKSLVARRLHLAFAGASYFERLLTRFTVPEELFGPLSIKGLEEDRYERLTGSYLPTASIAFLDEIFKANSAILNALLTLLNEREFDNGSVRTKTPLIAVVGASNELPEDGELDALFDRFLLRLHVGPVSAAAFPTLLALRGEAVPELSAALRWSVAEIAALHRAAEQVVVDGDVVALLCGLREWCAAENIAVSDRRWRKVIKLLQISAITNGRTQVSVWDCWLLQHCVWSTPEQRVKIHEWYESRVGASAAMDPSRLTRIVVSWEAKLKVDQDSRSQMRDEKGQLLYRGADGKPTPNTKSVVQMQRGTERLFLAPAQGLIADGYRHRRVSDRTNDGSGYTSAELDGSIHVDNSEFRYWPRRADYLADPSNWLTREAEAPPWIEPTKHKELYVDACIKQIDELRDEVVAYKHGLARHLQSLRDEITTHLWVPVEFAGPAASSLEKTRHEVEGLLVRVQSVRKGFELLPRESDSSASAAARPAAAPPGPAAPASRQPGRRPGTR